MARRVKLAFIDSDSARRAAYKKMRRAMMKELHELSTLDGIEACAIVYKPHDPQLEIWLSKQRGQRVMSRFARMPEVVQTTKKMNQESYLKQRIMEVKELLKKQLIENEKKEKTIRLYQYLEAKKIPDNLSLDELKDLALLIDQEMKGIEQTIAQMSQSQATVVAPAALDDGAAKNKGKAHVDVDGGHGSELILDTMEKQH